MDTLDETTNKAYIFEIYVKQVELLVDSKTLVNFVWTSDKESYTSLNVLLHADLNKHTIDQKLTLNHTFKTGFSSLSHLKLYDVTDSLQQRLLGECEVDLKKLLNVTNPVKFKLTNGSNGSIAIHTYITNSSKARSLKPSKPFVSPKPDLSHKKSEDVLMNRSLLANTISSFQDFVPRMSMDENDIYDKINKMSVKLSNIEREILRKTYKLNQLNKENVSEMNKIKTKLEKDLMKKDLQIKILVTQLDELHVSLAMSHQRELELSDRIQYEGLNPDAFTNNYALNNDTTDFNLKRDRYKPLKKHNLDINSTGYNRTFIDELETNINDLQRFKQDYETLNDPGTKINKFKDIITNFEKIRKMPKYMSRSSVHSSQYQNVSNSSLKNLSNEGQGSLKEKLIKRGFGMVRDRIPVNNTTNAMDQVGRTTVFDNKLINTRMSELKVQNKRVPAERSATMLQVPRLIETREKSNKIYGGGVFIPNVMPEPSVSDRKSVSSRGKWNGKSNERIDGLERELVTTKVKLADSETTKEVYWSKLMPNPPTVIA